MPTELRSLSNFDLLRSTKQVVARERGITIEVLDHFNEVERRELYLPLGHSSMFAYSTDELGYSASAAKRRISTARCIAQFPEALPMLRVNEVNLSTITQVFRIMKPHNGHAILDRIRGKSQREVEAIVAEFEPLEALPKDRARTVVVRVPVKPAEPAAASSMNSGLPLSSQGAAGSVERLQDGNGPESLKPATKLERRVVNQFSAREVVMNKIETVRALASHRLPINAPLEQVLEFLADYFLKREDPKQRHERRIAKGEVSPQPTSKTSSARAIPLPVRDEVFVTGKGQCSFVGPDGKRCGSKHVVQVDHIRPVARQGSASIENLRLLCAKHNRMEASRIMEKAELRPEDRNGPVLRRH
jgi:HNH endonuclease